MPMQQQGLMGLLSSPATQGLLAAGLGAMASRGNTMQALGRGGLLGLSTFGQAAGAQQNRLMEMAQDRMRQDLLGKLDQGQGLSASELSQLSDDPSKWTAIMQAGRPKLDSVDLGGQVGTINPYTGQLVTGFDKTPTIGEQMTNVNNPVSIGPNGQPQMNQTLWNTQQMAADADAQRQMAQSAYQQGLQNSSTFREVPMPGGGTQLMSTAQAMDTLGGQQAGGAQQDGADGRAGFAAPQEVQEFRARVPDLVSQSTSMLDSLSNVINHPGKDSRLGIRSYAPAVRGTEGFAFDAAADQIQSQVFLEGYERLKGGGVITDYEGGKAEKAISRLNTGLSPADYDAAVRDLADVVMKGVERTYTKANMPMPAEVREQLAQYRQQLGMSQQEQGLQSISDEAAYNSLPSGAVFVGPDGKTYRKP